MIVNVKLGCVASGRLGKDPETKVVGERQTKMTKFSICAFSDPSGNAPAIWIDVVAWNSLADFAEGLRKGDAVLVCGAKKERSYTTREGVDKTASELVAEFILPQPSNGHSGQNNGYSANGERTSSERQNNGYAKPQAVPPQFTEIDEPDPGLPF
ncbi:MAG: single-stranded DNA-binding protein [Oscillospiraceae bacterium]|jgi:single-strand DNA-binding protein|nr:single-stranded DNA-binding protein [Oscillospiraceae bacterium]